MLWQFSNNDKLNSAFPSGTSASAATSNPLDLLGGFSATPPVFAAPTQPSSQPQLGSGLPTDLFGFGTSTAVASGGTTTGPYVPPYQVGFRKGSAFSSFKLFFHFSDLAGAFQGQGTSN
jgi:hypothetical protein